MFKFSDFNFMFSFFREENLYFNGESFLLTTAHFGIVIIIYKLFLIFCFFFTFLYKLFINTILAISIYIILSFYSK
jgi:hypothetical protein